MCVYHLNCMTNDPIISIEMICMCDDLLNMARFQWPCLITRGCGPDSPQILFTSRWPRALAKLRELTYCTLGSKLDSWVVRNKEFLVSVS
jgi:hypothetical protein